MNRIFQEELSEVLQQAARSGPGNQSAVTASLLTGSEHKAVQLLFAKAFRRAVRRARSGNTRRRGIS